MVNLVLEIVLKRRHQVGADDLTNDDRVRGDFGGQGGSKPKS